MYQNSQNSVKEEQKTQFINLAESLSRQSSSKQINHKETHKKMLTSLAIREMQIKTTMRYHYSPIRVTKIKRQTTKCW